MARRIGKYKVSGRDTTLIDYDTANLTPDSMAVDNNASVDGTFVFDELGLRARASTLGAGILLSHVIFHPVEKSANRVIQVIYTIRIRCG